MTKNKTEDEMEDFIKWRKTPRLNTPCLLTEKIDGTNAQIQIVMHDGIFPDMRSDTTFNVVCEDEGVTYTIRAGSRNRWLSIDNDNYGFAAWVSEHREELIYLGAGRHYGEWWGKGIQRGYGLDERRFSLFDAMHWNNRGEYPTIIEHPGKTTKSKTVPIECVSVVPVVTVMPILRTDHMMQHLENLRASGSKAVRGWMRPEGIIAWHIAPNNRYKLIIEK